MIPLQTLRKRLARGKATRVRFVESHVSKGLAFQIRAMRDLRGWSQAQLAAKAGTSQSAIARLESTEYGRPSVAMLLRLASAFDVALIVRFAPFDEVAHWVSGTRRVDEGLNAEALGVRPYNGGEAA